MALRAGRGAQILMELEAKKKAKAEEARQIEEDPKNGIEHPKVKMAKGREALMAKFKKSYTEAAAEAARQAASGPETISREHLTRTNASDSDSILTTNFISPR